MWYKKIGCIIIASSLFLAGCSDDPNVSNENRGRLAGGLAGAAIANECQTMTWRLLLGL